MPKKVGRVVYHQQAQLDMLHQQHVELFDKFTALYECLEVSGVFRREAFFGQLAQAPFLAGAAAAPM